MWWVRDSGGGGVVSAQGGVARDGLERGLVRPWSALGRWGKALGREEEGARADTWVGSRGPATRCWRRRAVSAREEPGYASDAPGYASDAPGYASAAPGYASAAPRSDSVAPRSDSAVSRSDSVAPRSDSAASRWSSSAEAQVDAKGARGARDRSRAWAIWL